MVRERVLPWHKGEGSERGELLPHVEASNMLPLSSPSQKKYMPLPGFEPGSPQPQSNNL